MTIGLALSGGGVRSAAQLGVVKALQEHDIKPEIYTGTSGGSIVASMLAFDVPIDVCLDTFKKASEDILDVAFLHVIIGMILTNHYIEGFIKGEKLEECLKNLIGDTSLNEVPKKIGIIATDIDTGQEIIFNNGLYFYPTELDRSKIKANNYISRGNGDKPLYGIVRASCSLPGVFIPKIIGGRRLVDGGLTDNLPSDIAQFLGADKVISIDLGYSGETKTEGFIDTLQMSLNILMRRNVQDNEESFGCYLNPKIYDVHTLDVDRIDECYERGYKYGLSILTKVDDYLGKK